MTESQEEKPGYTMKDYAEMASGLGTGYGVLKGLAGRPAPYVGPAPYSGPAVGMPVPNGPLASQALRTVTGAIPEVAPEAVAALPEAAEVIGMGLAGAGEVAGATALGPLALAGLAGGGLYYLGKKLLDHNPDDRVAQSIVSHEVVKHQRAKALVPQMFDQPVTPVQPALHPALVDISRSEFDNYPTFHPIPSHNSLLNQPQYHEHSHHKTKHQKHKHHTNHKK